LYGQGFFPASRGPFRARFLRRSPGGTLPLASPGTLRWSQVSLLILRLARITTIGLQLGKLGYKHPDSLLVMITMFLFLYRFCLVPQLESESNRFVLSVFPKQQKSIINTKCTKHQSTIRFGARSEGVALRTRFFPRV
jgi:hypothetical protein